MITDQDQLFSLSQINRALKGGFAVEAEFVTLEASESFYRETIFTRWETKRFIIRKISDLNESMYNELVGIGFEEAYSYFDAYHCKLTGQWHWEFFAVAD